MDNVTIKLNTEQETEIEKLNLFSLETSTETSMKRILPHEEEGFKESKRSYDGETKTMNFSIAP